MDVSLAVAISLLTIVANGAVTFGVVKTTLRFLEKEIARVDMKAGAAHERQDKHVLDFHTRAGRR